HHQFYVLGSKEYHDKRLWMPFMIPIGPVAGLYGIADLRDNVVRMLRLFRLNVHSGEVTE
ncbi:MAG TPA: hypothetical protein VG605_18375, partial [Puia sp.]|nr:hypothetical protein [Puia sp.]